MHLEHSPSPLTPWLSPPFQLPRARDMARLNPEAFLDREIAAEAQATYGDGWRECRFLVTRVLPNGGFETVVQNGAMRGQLKLFDAGQLVVG